MPLDPFLGAVLLSSPQRSASWSFRLRRGHKSRKHAGKVFGKDWNSPRRAEEREGAAQRQQTVGGSIPRLRIRVNLSKAPEWFLGAALSGASNSLGRCSLWHSPLLSSAPRSRSVWSAAVDCRFPRTVLRTFPFQSGAEAHALQALRGTEHAPARAASVQGPHLSRPKVDAYARLGESPWIADCAIPRQSLVELGPARFVGGWAGSGAW